MLKSSKPELFTDDETGQAPTQELEETKHANRQKQEAIKNEIAKMQAADPHLSFQLAWNRLQKANPSLFNFKQAPVSSRPYAQGLPGVQQPTLSIAKAATVHAALVRSNERRHAAAIGEGNYIELRAEDVDEMEREIAAGLWD